MRCMTALWVSVAVLAAGQASDKELEKEAKKRTEAFEKEFNLAKTPADRVKAVQTMAGIQHAKVRDVLIRLLDGFGPEVSTAVAEELGKYSKSKEAAEALAQAIKSKQKEKELVKAFFRALGSIRYEPSVKFIHDYMMSQDGDIAAAAVDACAKIKSKETIDKLIPMLAILEEQDIKFKQMPPRDFSKQPTPQEQMLELERQRVVAVLPAVQGALAHITKQNHTRATDWAAWWRKNKSTFKVEE